MWHVGIKDPATSKSVKVTPQGQLVTAPLKFSTIRQNTLAIINTAYNFATPQPNQAGVITDIILSAGRDVGVNGALVEIYLTDSSTSTTTLIPITTFQMPAGTSIQLTGLNWEYTQGYWLSMKTDDNTIYASMAGYYFDL